MPDFRIINGPDTDALFDSFRHRRPVTFEIGADIRQNKLPFSIDMKLASLEFEDGSGVSFNLRGYVQTQGTELPNYLPKVYYHSGHRTGTILVETSTLVPA